ncbi:MAG: hypothetical protein OXL96_01075 [Candidatus Poribacteria bacterium]|nr:hypothetical protein [Candidatus Poribacteria bacterium]
MTEQMTAQESKQQAFDQATLAYVSKDTQENDSREQNALRLDTDNTFTPDSRFEFATPNWNDTLTLAEMFRPCGQVSETLKRMIDTLSPTDVIHDIRFLLNASFSQRIKNHIVMLVADTETVEGACRHCFEFYGEDSQGLDQAMTIWRTLTHVLDTVSVFDAFLERAWHLNPTSPYFPERYQEIADAVQEAQFDNRLRQRAPYANPYNQLQLLNETLKKLEYQFKHCDDPNQLCKLANSQVRVAGAMHVINEKLERQHQTAIRKVSEQHALNPPTDPE